MTHARLLVSCKSAMHERCGDIEVVLTAITKVYSKVKRHPKTFSTQYVPGRFAAGNKGEISVSLTVTRELNFIPRGRIFFL